MSRQAYTLIGLTGIIGGLIAVLMFAVLRFAAAARDVRRHNREGGMENALLTAALEDAITQLKAQERAMAARAEASERLSLQIVASLTAGLVVVDLDGQVRIVNPSSRRLLGLPDGPLAGSFRDVLGKASPLVAVIDECMREGHPILRRTLELNDARTTVTHLGVTVSPASSQICRRSQISKTSFD
jgi:nitrogen fixation/metabolism regulation signal transduction histidine kinase